MRLRIPTPSKKCGEFKYLQGESINYGGDILFYGVSTTRGRAARAMAGLIENDHKRISYFQPTLEKMVQESFSRCQVIRCPSIVSCFAS